MKSIEEIKIELTLKKLAGENPPLYANLPQDDELRTFVCSLGAFESYLYAKFVDKCPCEETRKAAYTKPLVKRAYIKYLGE